jgi:four helix bundle protein
VEKPHKKLDVWKEAVSLVVVIYELTEKFPKSEAFGLSNQIKRAVLSIAANIAEGAARQTKREFLQYLYVARGSLSEVDTFVEIAKKLGYVSEERVIEIERKMMRVDKMLTGLIQFLRKRV